MTRLLALLCVSSLAIPALAIPAYAAPLSENQKIEMLIATVENLKDAVFVRNGSEHDAVAAGKHLRDKWAHDRKNIATARDFIVRVGSGSSMTGTPYLIRFRDGREVKTGDFFAAQLSRLER